MLTDQELRMLQSQHPTENDPMPFARAVIAAYEAKLREQAPVAYSWIDKESDDVMVIGASNFDANEAKNLGINAFPMYKHPAPIPEGYALIPIDPTDAILKAINGATSLEQCYANILAAARSE